MCSSDPPAPVVPATPPPPPPVLEQAAPETKAPSEADSQNAGAQGVKKYRSSSLSIASGDKTSASTNNTGLGISM